MSNPAMHQHWAKFWDLLADIEIRHRLAELKKAALEEERQRSQGQLDQGSVTQ